MAIQVTHKFVSAIPDGPDATIVRPSNWNDTHTLTGVGTMATQDATAVAVTGGTINGTTIGATTPAAGTFTTLKEGVYPVVTQADVGTNANQVPLNQYLGKFAWMDYPVVGAMNYYGANNLGSFACPNNGYGQIIIQTTSTGTAASSDLVVSNSSSTDSTVYGNLGITGTGFNSAGQNIINTANTVYLQSQSAPLAIGTLTSNQIQFVANSTERMRLSAAGGLSVGTTTDAGVNNLLVAGNIGIGSVAPSFKLDVNGIARIVGSSASSATFNANQYIRLDTNANGGYTIGVPSAGGITTGYYFTSGTVSYAGGIEYQNTSNALSLRTNNTTQATIDSSGNLALVGVHATTAAAPTIASATTIAPTKAISFVSGVTPIATITPPSPISTGGGQITLIPTGIFTTTTAGNIALASTAVVSKALIMTYDVTTAKWYPSY